MTDPLSATAAVVGLAQIDIRLGQELFKLKRASAELRRLNRELEELANAITLIRDLSQTYQESDILNGKGNIFNVIESRLKSFVENATRLKNIVEELSRW